MQKRTKHCLWIPDSKPLVYCLSSNCFRHVVGHDTFTLKSVCFAMNGEELKLKVKAAAKPKVRHEGPGVVEPSVVEPFLATLSRALQPSIPPWRADLCLK